MEKHDELIEALGALTHDPLAFVYFAYPWGEPGTPLEDMEGPDEWQIQILKDIGEQLKKGKDLQTAIQEAVASGHGIGKSALISWLIHFAISTHENTRGVVTANTGEPVWFLKQYWGTGVETNGSGFSDPRFDELLALGESANDPVVRRNAVINAQQLMLDNAVALFLGYPKINIVGNKKVDGIKMTPSEYYIITKDLKLK